MTSVFGLFLLLTSSMRKTVQFLWLVGAFVWFDTAGADVLPARMEGQYAAESFHTVEIKVGTPCRLMRLLIDFNSNSLVTRVPVQVFSRSYSPAFGGSDVVHFGGKEYRVATFADGGSLAASMGCATCEGVIGLGAGSKIWVQSDEAIFTAGAVLMEEELIAFSRYSRGLGVVQCLPGFTNLCTAPAFLEGKPVVVYFGLPVDKTLVPPDVFLDYTAGMNVEVNPPRDWPNLHFKFPANPNPSNPAHDDANRFDLRREDIVTKSRRSGYDLLLGSSMSNTTVVLSRSAWRSFMIRKNWISGTAQIVPWRVRKHWSAYSLIGMLGTSILFLYWKLSPSGAWNVAYKAGWKVFAEALGFALAITTYALPMSQTALDGHVEVNIFFGCVLANMFLWQLFSCLIYFGVAENFLGHVTVPVGRKGLNPQARGRQQADSDNAGSIFPKVTQWNYSQDITVRRLNPRLWTVMSLSNETTVLTAGLLLVMETRIETLGNFFVLLFALVLLFNITYHLIVALNIPTGDRWRFAWALYWTNSVIVLAVGIIIVEVHIMAPFIARFIPAFPRIVPYVGVVVYAAALMLASTCAKFRSVYEESQRRKAMNAIQKQHI